MIAGLSSMCRVLSSNPIMATNTCMPAHVYICTQRHRHAHMYACTHMHIYTHKVRPEMRHMWWNSPTLSRGSWVA